MTWSQVQRSRDMNMCARSHRYISAAAAAFRSLVAAIKLRCRRRQQQKQQQQIGLASHRQFCSRLAFAAWFTVHCRYVRKRFNILSASSHFRRITLTRVVRHVVTRARYGKMLRVFSAAAAAVFNALLMEKVVGGWLELRWAWRAKGQR